MNKKSNGKKSRRKGLFLGNIEERLILGMEPGDTFLFAGQILRYEGIKNLEVEVTPSSNRQAKIPAFLGGKMPLSSYLASAVLELLELPSQHKKFPLYIQEWLTAQKKLSRLPSHDRLLVETFKRQNFYYLTAYTFQGRPANQTIGFLLSYRLEVAKCQPLGFAVSDYGISIWCLKPLSESLLKTLWHPDLCKDTLENWLKKSAMLKRFFRTTAIISGLIERKLPGQIKTGKQVTFSTDLIYDVLCKYDANHLLLRSSRQDAEQDLIELKQLQDFLTCYQDKILYHPCARITPFSIPIIVESLSENVNGTSADALLALHNIQEKAALLYQEALHG